MPPVRHPVILKHPVSKEPCLFVNKGFTHRIVGLPQEESRALLDELFDYATQRDFVYRHQWRVGDLLIWDNRCSMHAREDFPSDQRRLMLRTTVEGTVRPY